MDSTKKKKDNGGAEINLHQGHRARIREAVMSNGWESLNEHQLLEYMLFAVMPRQDTNELAHKLMNEFGGFAGVLDASIADLKNINGIGEIAAVYLNSFQNIFKVYKLSKLMPRAKITCVKEVYDYLGDAVALLAREEFYIICLDSLSRAILCKKIATGSVNQVSVSIKDVTETVFRSKASGIILVHNHPTGSLEPSQEDIAITRQIFLNLSLNGIYVLDHIIISQQGYYSFKHNGYFDGFEQEYKNLLPKGIMRSEKPKYK